MEKSIDGKSQTMLDFISDEISFNELQYKKAIKN